MSTRVPRKSKSKQSPLAKSPDVGIRAKVLAEAKRLFAKQGFEGTSVKEISVAAGANIAAVNYYFKDKEGLYREIIAEFGNTELRGAYSDLGTPLTSGDLQRAISSFLNTTLESVIDDLDSVTIVQREFEMVSSRADDIFQATFLKLFQIMVDYLSAAKSKKLLRKTIDPEFAAALLFNHISQALRVDRVNEAYFKRTLKDPAYRKRWIQSTCDLFFHAIEET